MELHESGCFYFEDNKVFVRKLAPGVRTIRFHKPNREVVESVHLQGKGYHLRDENVIMDVEMNLGNHLESRYFTYNLKEKVFQERNRNYFLISKRKY